MCVGEGGVSEGCVGEGGVREGCVCVGMCHKFQGMKGE